MYCRMDLPIVEQEKSMTEKIIIDDDVWIGARVTLNPGVYIKKGSIIGVGSVVKEDEKPYTIVGDSPAKIIKRRKEK